MSAALSPRTGIAIQTGLCAIPPPALSSYTAALLFLGAVKSSLPATVALSSCEAEIVAASEAAKEALYLKRFLEELGQPCDGSMSLGTDNQAARDLAYNPEHHSRTKHIERRHFFIRETVESLELTVPFVRSADNLADFFTKPLPRLLSFSPTP